jgi:hypothetical protein
MNHSVAQPASQSTRPPVLDKTFEQLRRFNAVMGVFHLVQFILMLVLSNDFGLPFTTVYLKFDPASSKLVQNLRELDQLPIGPAAAVFLLLSAIAHLILATFGYKWYVKELKKKMNRARWYEYALSSSLMIVIIAMLSGMYDLASLILIFALNAMMILFGLMMELHNQTTDRTDWTAFVFGCIAGIIPWITIAMYLVGANQSPDTDVPGFVYGIFFSLFVFFNIFAINMFLQYKQIGRWKDYLFGERMYIVLSLVAKSALAWQIFFGTLRDV